MQIKAVWFFNRYSAANLHTLGRSLVFDFSRTCAFALAFVLGTVTVMPIAVAKDAGDFVVRLRGIAVQTDIRVNGGTIRADDTDLDPLILGIGVGYKF